MFRCLVGLSLAAVFAAGLIKPVLADAMAMSRLTKAMVLEAADYYRSVSFEEARATFNDQKSDRWLRQPFHLHMFGVSADGIVWADNIFHEFVGVDFSLVYDVEGFAIGRNVIEQASATSEPSKHRTKFLSPVTNDETLSIGHCLRPDPDNIICAWSEQD